MAGESFGGYTPFAPQLGQQQKKSSWYKREQAGIASRNAAMAAREQREKGLEAMGTNLVDAEKVAEAQQEGDIAFGRLGRNVPRDTRAAQVLGALGIEQDLMRAIIASAQAPASWNNRGNRG